MSWIYDLKRSLCPGWVHTTWVQIPGTAIFFKVFIKSIRIYTRYMIESLTLHVLLKVSVLWSWNSKIVEINMLYSNYFCVYGQSVWGKRFYTFPSLRSKFWEGSTPNMCVFEVRIWRSVLLKAFGKVVFCTFLFSRLRNLGGNVVLLTWVRLWSRGCGRMYTLGGFCSWLKC